MPPVIAFGRIVWAMMVGPRGGNPKARPGVIITPDHAFSIDGLVEVLAITTLVGEAPFSETVELPFTAEGHPQTRLKRRCEVVCSWSNVLPIAELQDSGGFVPRDLLVEITAKYERLK